MQKKNDKTKNQPKKDSNLPIERAKTAPKQKSILKPFALFAVIVVAVGGAGLYAFMTQQANFPMPKAPAPRLNIEDDIIVADSSVDIAEEQTPVPVQDETPTPATVQEESCLAKDRLILVQKKTIDDLNQKIHQLELDKLNMSENIAASELATPLTARLMEDIYTGRPFGTTLKMLLIQDSKNPFALMVQEKLDAYATIGLPTAKTLKAMFGSQMKMAKNSFYMKDENGSLNDKWSAFFKSLVYVYPQNMNPNETSGINLLFLAKKQVDNDQFELAVKSIERLPGYPKQFLSGFVQNAKVFLEGQQIIKAYLNK